LKDVLQLVTQTASSNSFSPQDRGPRHGESENVPVGRTVFNKGLSTGVLQVGYRAWRLCAHLELILPASLLWTLLPQTHVCSYKMLAELAVRCMKRWCIWGGYLLSFLSTPPFYHKDKSQTTAPNLLTGAKRAPS
jgi:hypothetical protein